MLAHPCSDIPRDDRQASWCLLHSVHVMQHLCVMLWAGKKKEKREAKALRSKMTVRPAADQFETRKQKTKVTKTGVCGRQSRDVYTEPPHPREHRFGQRLTMSGRAHTSGRFASGKAVHSWGSGSAARHPYEVTQMSPHNIGHSAVT